MDDPFPNSNLSPTVVIATCDSGVSNHLSSGTSFNDLISQAAANAANHGAFVRAVTQLADQWKGAGLISGQDKGKITSCAARSKGNRREGEAEEKGTVIRNLFLPAINR